MAATVLLVPLAGRLAAAAGIMSNPRPDRWSGRPTPLLGGLAVFGGFLVPLPFLLPFSAPAWWVVLTGAFMLGLGTWDDKYRIPPQTKLVGQIVAACFLVQANVGFRLWPMDVLSVLFSIFWVVAVINSVNLMDNMDGLAPGVSLIAVGYLCYLLALSGRASHALLAASLAGSLGGFLLYNFPPARIFLGDSGSLSIGVTIAALTLSSSIEAEQKLGALSALLGPALVMAIPLLDVALVSVTRILSGRPVSQGGKDHSSHRLVQMGLTETQAVLTLYALSAVSGGGAIFLSTRWNLDVSVVMVPLLWLALGIFFVYLARFHMTERPAKAPASPEGVSLILGMAFKRRILEVIMDLGVAFVCFWLAYLLRFDFEILPRYRTQIIGLLPWVLGSAVACFQFSGLYGGLWEHQGMRDVGTFLRASASAAGAALLFAVLVYRFERFPRSVFLIYGVLLLLAIAATRSSFKLLEIFLAPGATHRVPVLIYGIGDRGITAFHELTGRHGVFRPVGFLQDDPDKQGLKINGLPILGTLKNLGELAQKTPFEKIIIADPLKEDASEVLRAFARASGKEIILFQISYRTLA